MNFIATVCLCMLSFLTACASTSMLPNAAANAGFDNGIEGKTGWSKYEEVARFENSTREQIFNAAKTGLGSADFALVSANLDLPETKVVIRFWVLSIGCALAGLATLKLR